MMTPASEEAISPSTTASPDTILTRLYAQEMEDDDDDASGNSITLEKDSLALLTPEQAQLTLTPSTSTTNRRSMRPLQRQKRDYTMRKCSMPSPSELQPIEAFVMNAIQSKHSSSSDPIHEQGYRAILDALRRPVDPPMVRLVLIALRTAGNGTILNQITSHSTIHAQLIHWIFRFHSSISPKQDQPMKDDNDSDDDKDEDDEEQKREHEQLMAVVKDGSLLDAHLHLVLAMVSAHTVNLIPALTAVWRMLSEDSDLSEDFQQRLHAMLYSMMRLVPKARSDILPIIAAKIPFWKANKEKLIWYCTQAFQVLEYVPSIRKSLLELVIEKCLEIDINIKIKDNGEASLEEQAEKEKDGYEKVIENDGVTTVATPLVPETPVPDTPPTDQNDVDILSDSLDSLLTLLLDVMSQECSDRQGAREVYYEILPVFETTIITTYKSKFVQYCLFYLCGIESDCGLTKSGPSVVDTRGLQDHSILHRDFASKLLEIVVDPYRAMMTRQSAACYLASFVSRATFVESETICESISALLRWAEAYMDSLASNSIWAADTREQSELHSLFYTVCQAAFYIMCFRGKDAIQLYREALIRSGKGTWSEGNDDDMLQSLPDPNDIDLGADRWTRVCNHDLQPLRFCLESVRSEFLHVAHFYSLIDPHVLNKLAIDAKQMSTGCRAGTKKTPSTITTPVTLEKQRRKGGVGGLGRGSNPLKSFFPFDPLLLRRSHMFVEPFYMHWPGPAEEHDDLVVDGHLDNQCDDKATDYPEVFAMDEDEQDVESDDGGEDNEDDTPVIVSDHDTKDEINDGDSDCEPDKDNSGYGAVDDPAVLTNEEQKNKFADGMKRPRSQSMENGSW